MERSQKGLVVNKQSEVVVTLLALSCIDFVKLQALHIVVQVYNVFAKE